MQCPACHADNPPGKERCQTCGQNLPHALGPVAADDEVDVVPIAPVATKDVEQRRPGPKRDDEVDVVSLFIPYRNPRALAAYYCGFFALLPGIGFILGIVAIVLGIRGLLYAGANPTAKGAVHAIVGIILGAVAFFCWNPLVCLLLWFTYFFEW